MRVAITGGTGSLGHKLLERLASGGADRIVTMTRDEHKRARLQEEFAWNPAIKVYAGDIRDEARLCDLFAGCEVVIHAAARKVVSGHYDEPREMYLTNIGGTVNVLSAARAAGVGRVLFISSDKAVAPINVYGVSKAMAEHLVVSENARSFAHGLRCSVIRYGNVLASNGSVAQKWRKHIAEGTPLPLSSSHMTRFWMTIGTAADHVLRAVHDMRGGEIFVPMMRSAPLVRLALALHKSNDHDLEFDVQGIRPGGEKMHESLLSEEELRRVLVRESRDWAVVPPLNGADIWDATPWLGERPPEGFTYDSDSWPHQWSTEALREAMALAGVAICA